MDFRTGLLLFILLQNAPMLLVNEGTDADFDTQRSANSAHAGDCIAVVVMSSAAAAAAAAAAATPSLS